MPENRTDTKGSSGGSSKRPERFLDQLKEKRYAPLERKPESELLFDKLQKSKTSQVPDAKSLVIRALW